MVPGTDETLFLYFRDSLYNKVHILNRYSI